MWCEVRRGGSVEIRASILTLDTGGRGIIRSRYDAVVAMRLSAGGQCDNARDGEGAMVVQNRKLRYVDGDCALVLK